MSNIKSIQSPHQTRWNEAAQYFRELADRFERGEILNCVVVLNDREEKHFEAWGDYTDRWHILGALEYAKSIVIK